MLPSTILVLALQCAPLVAPATILKIVSVEAAQMSNGEFNVNSLNLNRGSLTHQPKNRAEALSRAKKHIGEGKTVDIGLMQVNSSNLQALNLSLADAFDPCKNIAAGSNILTAFYLATDSKQHPQVRLLKALSAYNTGNFKSGFENGYISRYLYSRKHR